MRVGLVIATNILDVLMACLVVPVGGLRLIVPTAMPQALASPTSLTTTAAAADRIDLAWVGAGANETSYVVERSINGTDTWAKIASLVSTARLYSDTGLTQQTTYYHRVKARYAAGDSAYSNVAVATTPAAVTRPNAPSGLNAVAATAGRIDLSWVDNSTDETSFVIERSLDGSSGWTVRGSVLSNITTYSDVGLATSTTYYYRVKAHSNAGDSTYSNTASGTTPSAQLGPQIFSTYVAGAAAKAAANTQQWQDFKAKLDADLAVPVESYYYYDSVPNAAGYALGYHCLKSSNPTLAADYAGKALGIALSAVRDSHTTAGNNKWQFLGQGDGANQDFALPGTMVGTVAVYSVPIQSKATTKGSANGLDDSKMAYADGKIRKLIKITTVDSVTAPAAYVAGTDYKQTAYINGIRYAEDAIDWSLGGSEPATGSTYYCINAPMANVAAVSPVSYSIAGTTLHFNVAPANDQAIFIVGMYHSATLRYQQTGNGVGGVGVGIASQYLYADRFFGKAVGPVYDWLQDFAPFTTALKTEMADALVAWSDASRDIPFEPKTNAGNYGIGRCINRAMAAVALEGRHAQAARLKSEMQTFYPTYMRPQYGLPDAGRTSLKGGWSGEGLGSYAQFTAEHNMLSAAVLGDTNWFAEDQQPSTDIATFANEVIQFGLHSRYWEAGFSDGVEIKPGYAYTGGDSGHYPVQAYSKRLFAIASGLASDSTLAANARHLAANKPGDIFYSVEKAGWDLLFRNPAATTTDWSSTLPLSYFGIGQSILFSRSDWNYNGDSTWLAAICVNMGTIGQGQQTPGDVNINRGNDRLIPGGYAIGQVYYSGLTNVKSGLSNLVVIDDGGAYQQSDRWRGGSRYGYFGGGSNVAILANEDANGHLFASFNLKPLYNRDLYNANSVNPLTTLQRDFFHVRPGYVVVYDRVTTTQAGYAKHLRWHRESTAAPISSGTITLTNGSGSTNAIAWNASAATVQTELVSLYGAGNVTVAKRCDGYWIATFTAGSTNAALTGTATATNGVVTVYDYHPQNTAGARTVQHIVLGQTFSGTDSFDFNSSRVFIKVDSPDSLTLRKERIDAADGGNLLCQRLVFHPTSAVAATRFISTIQTATTATGSMDAQARIIGSNSQLEGVRIGSTACMFRVGTSVTVPDTMATTYNGTLTWRVSGLTPNHDYALTGATAGTVTTSAAGVAVFTSTSASSHSVTIDEPAVVPASYQKTITEVGVDSILSAWYTAEQAAQGTSTPVFSIWQVGYHNLDGSDYPGLLVGQHSSSAAGAIGVKILTNATPSPGGTMTFTDGTASYGRVARDFGSTGGFTLSGDLNGDGKADLWTARQENVLKPIYLNVNGTLTPQSTANGNTFDGTGDHYIRDIGDLDNSGVMSVTFEHWPTQPNIQSPLNASLTRWKWNGSSLTKTDESVPTPTGVPQAVIDDLYARIVSPSLSSPVVTAHTIAWYHPMDLNNDGVDDLVIFTNCVYQAIYNVCYFLVNNGNGTYTDKTADWGLSRMGTFLPLSYYHQMNTPRWITTNNKLQKSIDGAGTLCLFVAGTGGGYYKWNGSGYTRQSGDALDTRLRTTDNTDNYLAQLYAADLTNSGRYDMIYRQPRTSKMYVYTNNGSGTFTFHSEASNPNYVADPYGACVQDFDNDGLLEIAVVQPGATKTLRMWKNTTTNPGRYLKVKLRRSTTSNKFGVGSVIQVFAPGSGTVLYECNADPTGVPVHFGVGARTSVDVKVTWPDGTTTTQSSVATNATVTFTS